MEKKKKIIALELVRRDGQTYLKFDIPKAIENLFKKRAKEVRKSESWPGLEFYYVPEITTSSSYKSLVTQYYLIDDFGTAPYANRYLNIAFLRTVGGKGELKLAHDIPYSEVSTLVRNAVQFIKTFYQEYLNEYSVKGKITVEV